ncbi:serine proteinase stubble-like [Amphibalanus amphitrite]|uniref:serine proteinase stubble-like n=1 Tax=Amphibalanus amphitrite TaxID=1232801 RepID=UPI001C918F68|nr:serine proteinase stubble-like [Amphibalanus amphitrite]
MATWMFLWSATMLAALGTTSAGHGFSSASAGGHKCWSPRGAVGSCQTIKECGLVSSYSILHAVRTRLCYWRSGQPFICCPKPVIDLSAKRRFWYGFFRGKTVTDGLETGTTATPPVEPPTFTTTTTTEVPTIFHRPTVSPPSPSTSPPTSRPPSPSITFPSDQSLVGAESVPVPSKRLRPPPPPAVAVNVSLVEEEEEEEELPVEAEKDMPTLDPFPMNHKEGVTKPSDSPESRDSTDGVCGRSDPVVLADELSAQVLREAFPEVKPVFAVPGGAFGKEARVTGGFASVQGRWPWMAMLGKLESSNITWLCGGSIIDEYHILTAAHCALERPNIVRVGGHNIELDFRSGDRSERHEVAKLTLHPQYRPPRSYHDIAIVTLRRALVYSRFVRPICLPPPDLKLRRGMAAKITGHGYQEFNAGELSAQLREAQIQLVRRKFCNASYARLGRAFFDKYPSGVLSHIICAGDEKGGVDACQGDSGGPLVQHNEATNTYHQIGVISSGFGCGNPEYPGLYVSVKHHLKFIAAVSASHWSHVKTDPTEAIRPRSAELVKAESATTASPISAQT